MHPGAHSHSQPSPPGDVARTLGSQADVTRTLGSQADGCAAGVSLEAPVVLPGVGDTQSRYKGDWLMRHVVAAATQVSPRSARLKELLERARH